MNEKVLTHAHNAVAVQFSFRIIFVCTRTAQRSLHARCSMFVAASQYTTTPDCLCLLRLCYDAARIRCQIIRLVVVVYTHRFTVVCACVHVNVCVYLFMYGFEAEPKRAEHVTENVQERDGQQPYRVLNAMPCVCVSYVFDRMLNTRLLLFVIVISMHIGICIRVAEDRFSSYSKHT